MKIGTYNLGVENVRLELSNERGASFTLRPAVIYIGKHVEWANAMDMLLHEAFEFTLSRMGLRLCASPAMSRSHADYVFHMTHEQFAEVCARVGAFITEAAPAFKKALGADDTAEKIEGCFLATGPKRMVEVWNEAVESVKKALGY